MIQAKNMKSNTLTEQTQVPCKARSMAGIDRSHKKQAFRCIGVVKNDFPMTQVEPPQKPLTFKDAITMKQTIK